MVINGQATHGARKDAWRTQAAWAKIRPTQLCVEFSWVWQKAEQCFHLFCSVVY